MGGPSLDGLKRGIARYLSTWWLLMRHPLDAAVLYDRRKHTLPSRFIIPSVIAACVLERVSPPGLGEPTHYIELVIPWTFGPVFTSLVDMAVLGVILWLLAVVVFRGKPAIDRRLVHRRTRDMLICCTAGPFFAASLVMLVVLKLLLRFVTSDSLAPALAVFAETFAVLSALLFYCASIIRRLYSQTWAKATLIFFLAVFVSYAPRLLSLERLGGMPDEEQTAARAVYWIAAAEREYHGHFGRFGSLPELRELRLSLVPFAFVPPANRGGYEFEINAQEHYFIAFARPEPGTAARALCADMLGHVFVLPREKVDLRKCRGKLVLGNNAFY